MSNPLDSSQIPTDPHLPVQQPQAQQPQQQPTAWQGTAYPPQYSQPYTQMPGFSPAPAQPAPQPNSLSAAVKKPQTWLIGCGTALALMIVAIIGCCALSNLVPSHATTSGSSSVNSPNQPLAAAPKATATATPKPAATPNPNASAKDWEQLVATDSSTLVGDANSMSSACDANSGDLESCKTSLQNFDSDVQQFQADLQAHPAPPCMTAANGYLQSALHDYDMGTQKAIAGIDDYSTNEVSQGAAQIQNGTTILNKATAAAKAAHC